MDLTHLNHISDSNYRLFNLRKSIYFANIWVHQSKDVTLIEYKDNYFIDTKEAEILIEQLFLLSDGKYNRAVSDIRVENHLVSENAKSLLANNRALKCFKKKTVVLESLPSRINTNYFIKAHKPITPFRYYDSLNEALDWLEEDEGLYSSKELSV